MISLSLLLLLLSGPAFGAEPAPRRARLVYQRGPGAESCPSERQLKDRVAARLGYDPFVDESTTLILATVTAAEAGLTGVIQISREGTPAGERTLTASDCGQLSAAMELALALAIDPLFGMPGRRAPVVAQPPPPVLPTPEPAPEQPPWSTHLALGALLNWGATPKVAPGVEVQVRLQRSWLSFGVEGRAQLPTSIEAEGGAVDVFPTTGGLAACGHAAWWMGCATATAGVLRVSGRQFDDSNRVLNPYATLGGRFAAELPARIDYSLRLQADVAVPIIRTLVRANGVNIWRSPDVSVSVGVMVVRHFW